MGKGYLLPSRLAGLADRRELPGGIRDAGPAENEFGPMFRRQKANGSNDLVNFIWGWGYNYLRQKLQSTYKISVLVFDTG